MTNALSIAIMTEIETLTASDVRLAASDPFFCRSVATDCAEMAARKAGETIMVPRNGAFVVTVAADAIDFAEATLAARLAK